MAKKCVCGKTITIRSRLCNRCLEEFGTNPKEWPEWVKFLVSEEKKEIDREMRHRELFLEEEKLLRISDEAEHNLSRAKRFPEMDFEDFSWMNQ